MDVQLATDREVSGAALSRIEAAVTVIVVNFRTSDLVERCLKAVASARGPFRNLRVILVDGGSDDGSSEALRKFIERENLGSWVELVALPINGGFGWANNQAILRSAHSACPPDYIYLLNPDAEISSDAIWHLVRYLQEHPGTGAVGSQLLDPDGSSTSSGFLFPSVGSEFARGARTQGLERLLKIKPPALTTDRAAEVDWVTGASVMIRAEALRESGLFDEGFFLYFEEVELMWRLRKAGWTVATEPRSRVRHLGGAATGVNDSVSGRVADRRPAYLYRSRTRFFGVTRGLPIAAVAFAAWLAGYAVWKVRRLLGLAPQHKPVDRQLRDHLLLGFPRKHDGRAAAVVLNSEPTKAPIWMSQRWL